MGRKRVIRTNKHHRLSRSRSNGIPYNGVIHGIPNVQVVNYKQHQAFHKLFFDTHPENIVRELNNNWVDPNYILIAIPRDISKKILGYMAQLL